MQTLSDEPHLIARIGKGDSAALAELYDRYSGPVYSMVLRMTRDEAETEQIVQDVFIAVWRTAASFDAERAKVFTWLTTLARNKAIDRIRANRRRAPALVLVDPDLFVERSVMSGAPAYHSAIREEADRLKQMMRALPADQSEAIQSAFFDASAHAEIAGALDEANGTVKAQIRLGMEKLRQGMIGGRPLIPEELEEQAALYALDALDDAERAEFLRAVRTDAKLAMLVSELRDAAAGVAFLAQYVVPPAYLKQRILSEATRDRMSAAKTASNKSLPVSNRAAPGLASLVPWALAAGFAVFAGILWGASRGDSSATAELALQREIAFGLYQRIAVLESELAVRDREIGAISDDARGLREQAKPADVRLVTLSSRIDASLLAFVVWDALSQKGVLQVRRLPVPESDQDYQLWIIDPDLLDPVSAGVFRVNPDGSATVPFAPIQKVGATAAFAVTLEKAGGEPAPTGVLVIAN